MAEQWEQRVEELESRLSFQDDTMEHLNVVVARQDREIRALHLRLAELAARFKELADASQPGVGSADFEVPPHY